MPRAILGGVLDRPDGRDGRDGMMPRASRLARLLQVILLAAALIAVAWLVAWWTRSPTVAVAGVAAIVFGHGVVLGIEFMLLRQVGKQDPAPLPTWRELVSAWWGETVDGWTVFCWRQPFRWRAEPDFLAPETEGRRGAVFLHGFVCNRGFWTPWLGRLREGGHAFAAVNLEPVFTSIDDYVTIVDEAVRRVTDATGMAPLLVCHSMGGLAARAWLRAYPRGQVHHVVTIGTPHAGTWLGRFSRFPNGRQMRIGSDWLGALSRHEAQVPFTCWYSNCDNIVFPASTATLKGADNRLLRGAAHVEMAFEPPVLEQVMHLLRKQD